MTSSFSTLIDFIHAHSQYTHIAIFLLALSEAIPVVGTVVPGSTLIIGISALATSANANPWLLVIAAKPPRQIFEMRPRSRNERAAIAGGPSQVPTMRPDDVRFTLNSGHSVRRDVR